MKHIGAITFLVSVFGTIVAMVVGVVIAVSDHGLKVPTAAQVEPPKHKYSTVCIDGVVYIARSLKGNGYITVKFNREGEVEVCDGN